MTVIVCQFIFLLYKTLNKQHSEYVLLVQCHAKCVIVSFGGLNPTVFRLQNCLFTFGRIL